MHSQMGELQMDEARGVLWFTPAEGEHTGRTTLRICGLPKGLNLQRPLQDVTIIECRNITQPS